MKRMIALVLSLVMALSLCAPVWGAGGEANKPADLPVANVTRCALYENVELPWGSYGQWSPTVGLDSQLEAVYIFSCEDTPEEAEVSPYANWLCDFYVKLDRDLGENQIFLGGNYGSFGWVGFHNGDLTLEANTEIPLLGSVAGSWSYLDVVQNVGTFICGVGDVDNALDGATFTVMLRLTNPEDETESYDVSTIEYKFAEPNKTSVIDVTLPAGDFVLYQNDDFKGKTLTIKGTKDTVIDVSDIDTRDQFVTGATLKFEGVTLKFNEADAWIYMGFANVKSLTYKNCRITGLQFLMGENITFDNCVIDSTDNTLGEPHSIWTYGAKNINFIDCEISYSGRAINCYKDEDIDGGKQVVNFTNCTFITEDTNAEGAVEINSSPFSVGIEVNLTDCVAPAYGEMAYVSQWDSTDGAKTTINKNYTVKFVSNFGNSISYDYVVAAGSTLPEFSFAAPDGYIFKGWALTADATEVLDAATYTVTTPVTLYAIWEEITYTVSFDANGGTKTMAPVTVPAGDYALPECAFAAPAGKQFKGWATSKDATEVLGETYKVTGDVTFYAVWEDAIVPVPVPDKDNNETSVEVEAVVSGTTATINKVEKLEEITSSDAKAESVTLDFSEVKGAVENTDGEVVETPVSTVVIPAASVEKIVEVVASTDNNVNNLEIVTADATVTFDTEATKAIGTNAGNAAITFTVDVETVSTATDITDVNKEAFDKVMEKAAEGKAVLLSIDMTGATENDKLFSEGKSAGTASVKVKLADGLKSATLYYLKGDEAEYLGSYNADAAGYITVTLEHFSEYVLLGSTDTVYSGGYYPVVGGTSSSTADKTVTSAKTFDAGIGMYAAMSVMAAAGSAIVIGKKKEF